MRVAQATARPLPKKSWQTGCASNDSGVTWCFHASWRSELGSLPAPRDPKVLMPVLDAVDAPLALHFLRAEVCRAAAQLDVRLLDRDMAVDAMHEWAEGGRSNTPNV